MVTISLKTIEDAAKFWINRDWSMIPNSLIERAFRDNQEDLNLIAGGARKSDCHDADVTRVDCSNDEDTDREFFYRCEECNEECETHWQGPVHAWPAAWGTMFRPEDDQDWIRSHADEIADLGFMVYDSDETGVILGIDGAGYDFYADHWIPLYKLRGFEWHDTTPAAPVFIPDHDPPIPSPSGVGKRASKRKATRKVAKRAPAKRPRKAAR